VYATSNWWTSTLNKTSSPNGARWIAASTSVNGAYFQKSFDLRDYTNPKISFWYTRNNMDATVDYSGVKYSADGGTTWVNILPRNYVSTTATVDAQNVPSGGTVSLPSVANVIIRFEAQANATNEYAAFDDIKITGLVGRTCHNVQSVDVIHNNSIATVTTADTTRCKTCHTSTAVPTTKNCEDAACHGGIHPADHTPTNSPECVSCHDAATDVRPLHANKGVNGGCNVCHGGFGYPQIHVGKTADCAQSGCHATELPVYTAHYAPAETSHTAGTTQGSQTLGTWALSARCDACHTMNLGTEHSADSAAKSTVPDNYCVNCHRANRTLLGWSVEPSSVVDANWPARSTAAACIACHQVDTVTTGHGQISVTGNHVVTDAVGQTCAATGAGCHPTANMTQVGTPTTTANIHLACTSCHGTSSRAGLAISGALAQGCNADARCHSVGYAGTTHRTASGDDATHTATGMNADADPAYSNGDLCSNCHSGTLSKAHTDTSTTASLGTGRTGWGATAQSSCQDCHNATATTGYAASANIVKGTWNDQCSACHTTKHPNYTQAKHTATAGNGTGSGGCVLESGCHAFVSAQSLDVRGLHNSAAAGCTIAGTDANGNPGACHSLDKAMNTTAMSCGEGGTGQNCHQGYNEMNHGADHNYEPISTYTQSAETAGSEAGCAGSGTGCHGLTTVNKNAVYEIHPSQTMVGCGPPSVGGTNADACHASPTMDATWKAADKRANCYRCHNNNFTNAPQAWPLYEASSGGHYSETTHTVSGMDTTVGSGGTVVASCATCHSTTLRDAHGAAGGGVFRSTTKGGYITCAECHGYNAAVSALTTDAVRTNTCAACHTAGVLGAGHAPHAATSTSTPSTRTHRAAARSSTPPAEAVMR
jgi:hypothetical protein